MSKEIPSVRVLCGERSIGGTIISVEQGGARLYIDAGLRYDPASDGSLERRKGRELHDKIRLGITVNIPALYNQRDVPYNVREIAPAASGPVAVAFTHSHLDHTALAGNVIPEVPIYATAETNRVVCVHSIAGRTLASVNRELTAVTSNQKFEIGDIKVWLVPTAHDVPGSAAIFFETRDGVGVYTSDYSLHSGHIERMQKFIETAREAKIKLLITEGTMLYPPPDSNQPPRETTKEFHEDEVAPEIRRIISDTKGLAVMLLMPDNAERMEAITKEVAESGRMMVFDADGLVYAYAGLGRPIDAPHRLFLGDGDENDLYLRDKLREMSSVLPEVVSPEEIATHQGDYALRLEFKRFSRLLDILPGIEEGALIHSGGLPIGPFDPDWKNMLDLGVKLNLKFNGIYCSGHANPEELAQVTQQINAPTVMVVHSYHPELFPVGNSKLLLPRRGQRYEMTVFG